MNCSPPFLTGVGFCARFYSSNLTFICLDQGGPEPVNKPTTEEALRIVIERLKRGECVKVVIHPDLTPKQLEVATSVMTELAKELGLDGRFEIVDADSE